jgi:hypothetical protein
MKKIFLTFSLASLSLVLISSGCDVNTKQQKSDSGVTKASIEVKTDAEGHTTEQKNIMKRLERDNAVGEIKHLYVISSYSGDVLEYSTVVGKVTSGGKRLSPKTVLGSPTAEQSGSDNVVYIGNTRYTSEEVLDDGGAYGESGNYLYWFDAQDNYHQYYPSGGTYLHISEKPLRIRKSNMTFSME